MQVNRGDSFMLPLQVFVDDAAQDCTNWQVHASYGTDSKTIGHFTISWQNRVEGNFVLTADTAAWPLGSMQFAVTYVTDAGQEITTQPVKFEVLRRLTPVPLP